MKPVLNESGEIMEVCLPGKIEPARTAIVGTDRSVGESLRCGGRGRGVVCKQKTFPKKGPHSNGMEEFNILLQYGKRVTGRLTIELQVGYLVQVRKRGERFRDSKK